jgi:putative CocE/NonD family hydrolase
VSRAFWRGLTCIAIVSSVVCEAIPAIAWTPGPATYGVEVQSNEPITMRDGTVLRADVYYPTDPKTGRTASGTFPVLVTQTPYGKQSSFSDVPEDTYMVQHGYIGVIADIRGTGGSQGQWGLLNPVQASDGATLVRWAAKLPHSDGKVGLMGGSYLGLTQMMTAGALGSNSPIKAIMPVATPADPYRDSAFDGGFEDFEFDNFYLGLTATLNLLNPLLEGDATNAMTDHIHDLATFDATLASNIETGGSDAYDGSYWQQREITSTISRIVANRIPALLVGGWFDLFQRGEPLNYAAFQNAYDHRPLLAPMTPTQPVTARYQLIDGPWYHGIADGTGFDYQGRTLSQEQLAWFDYWLKGINTGVTDTRTPLHLGDIATGQWFQAQRYPLSQATPTSYYLQSDGSLTPNQPPAGGVPQTLLFTGSQIPCTASTEQWIAGIPASELAGLGLSDPCETNAGLSQIGPGTRNFTTTPFAQPTTIAGPISATLYASADTTDTEWVVQLSDVAPSGDARPLTEGVLRGAQRAIDSTLSWYAPDGHPLLPYHPYTAQAETVVHPGQVTRYDVEVFPVTSTLLPGHRLRVTITTGDFPHVLPTLAQLPRLLGGVYELEDCEAYPSSVELPLTTPARLAVAGSAQPVTVAG